MKKLNATQKKARDSHAAAIRSATEGANTAIDKYNAAVDIAKADAEAALAKLNEAIVAAGGWRDEIVSEMESYESERSERWFESDGGCAFVDWKGEFENLEMDEIEVEFPDPMEHVEAEDKADALDQLPDVAG